jgi:serine/threonine-protein kinase
VEGLANRDLHATVITPTPPRTAASGKRSAFDGVTASEPWRFLPGDRLGDYELLEFVGGGGMGRVYRARDVRLDRVVALKVLTPDQASDPNTLLRFQNEAQSAARLDHQNIARVFHVGEEQGIPYIAFEFIEGVNARDWVAKKGALNLAEALGYTLQVAEGLSHAANRNVVHRDIKPSNLLITPEGTAKLIDLGLARLNRDTAADDLTATGVTLGTFDYISPEQARDPRTADVRSDIYSLGCTFFFMLTGRPPFPQGTMLQKLLQHQGDQPPDVREFRPDLPEEVSRILRKMLAKDPRHRYQHPGELLEELLRLAEEVGLRPLQSAGNVWGVSGPAGLPFWERHLPWAAPAVVLLAIVLGLDFLSSRREEDRPAQGVGETIEPLHPEVAAVQSARRLEKPAPATNTAAVSVASSGAAGSIVAGSGAKLTLVASPSANPMLAIATVTSGGTILLQGAAKKPAELLATTLPQATNSHAGVLIVGDALPGEKAYASLNAACSEAGNGDVVELRYQGSREQQPVTLANRKVTIRAGEGYHPVLAFRPADADSVRPRSMVSVLGGQLTLVNLALELQIPRDMPAENWSLFELLGGDVIRLESCWLTIRGSAAAGEDPQEAAFFRFKVPAGGESAAAEQPSAAPPTIELVNCVARGEATFLQTASQQAMQLTWENGLLITSQYLLSADGGTEPPRAGEARRIELRHVTAVTRRGLCRMNISPSAPHQALTAIFAGDSILFGTATAAMIEMVGLDNTEDCRRWLQWNGDRNFYQGWESFRTISTLGAKTPQESLTFEGWQSCWGLEKESQPTWNQVVWNALPDANRPLHGQTPADYALLPDASRNPARGAARNGDDVGFRALQLPPPPAASLPETAGSP